LRNAPAPSPAAEGESRGAQRTRRQSMEAEQLYHLLKEGPFPKRVHLKDGRAFDIPLRELVVVGRTFVDIGVQAPDEPQGICQGIVTFAPDEFLRVEGAAKQQPHYLSKYLTGGKAP